MSDKLYLRDPQTTRTGQALITHSIRLIDQVGFENVTFKKIAAEMHSTEATIYRYFGNKFRLLQYLVDSYWTLINFQFGLHLNNITTPEEKLKVCIHLLAGTRKFISVSSIDTNALQRIVISELDKTYLSRSIDKDYRNGLLDPFKETCSILSSLVREVNPQYPFPNSLVSTVLNAVTHQPFYSEHMPSFSDITADNKHRNERLYDFVESFVFKTIQSAA